MPHLQICQYGLVTNEEDHIQRFLPDGDFVDVSSRVKILRNANGTAFINVIPSDSAPLGSNIAPGQYRQI